MGEGPRRVREGPGRYSVLAGIGLDGKRESGLY